MPISLKEKREAAGKVENPFYKFLNVNRISDATGINSDKIYNNMKGFYDSLGPKEKKVIATTLFGHVQTFFKKLGYTISIARDDS
jgi:hypothetical protein